MWRWLLVDTLTSCFTPLQPSTKFPRLRVPKWSRRGEVVRARHRMKANVSGGAERTFEPSSMPITRIPYSQVAVFTTARITALRPGASPPPVGFR